MSSRRISPGAAVAIAIAVAVSVAVGSAPGRDTAARGLAARAKPYAVAPTRRCLSARKLRMTKIRVRSGRLKELADLAQKTSFEVRVRGRIVGVAFGNSALLTELLRVPGNRHRLERRRNVLLVYLPAARSQAAVVRACLRSR